MDQITQLALLAQHNPIDAEEAAHLFAIRTFIANTREFHARSTLSGHVTASGWVINSAGTHAILLFHKKLQRWLQPGGHIEAGDPSLLAAATREVVEETGLTGIQPLFEHVFDVDAHLIPTSPKEAQHTHYDCRFLFQTTPEQEQNITISDESEGFKLVPLNQLVSEHQPGSLRRMIIKSMLLKRHAK